MEVNEYDTATLWRYRIETAVHVASQQKHSKQVDRLRWIVSRKIYAAAKGDCNEKVRRGNPPNPEEALAPRSLDACRRQATDGHRQENSTNTRPRNSDTTRNRTEKGGITPKLKPAAHLQISHVRSGTSHGIARMCLDLNYATKIYVERELKTNVVN